MLTIWWADQAIFMSSQLEELQPAKKELIDSEGLFAKIRAQPKLNDTKKLGLS